MRRATPIAIWAIVIATAASSCFASDWNKQLAAEYLDARQEAWFAWRAPAKDAGGACLSCHTGLTYLLARPALRAALHDATPTKRETALREGITFRLESEKPGRMFKGRTKEPELTQAAAVQAVVETCALATGKAPAEMLAKSLDRMLQLQDAQGGFPWFDLHDSPWEEAKSGYFGGALAAAALDMAPAGYTDKTEVKRQIAAFEEYLKREFSAQPLHHRLTLLSASQGIGKAVPADVRQATLDETARLQHTDGGWTIAELGPWKSKGNLVENAESDNYATAIAVMALQRAGGAKKSVESGLAFLRTHQDAATGAWLASSMNHKYPPESMMFQFMNEAATAYAAIALLESEKKN